MAEKRGRFLFNPSFNAFIKRLTTKAPKRAIKKISSLAFELLMTSWTNGQGYDEKGNKTSWSRSPDSTRANDIMIDTGHLKSSVIIKLIDDGFDYKFEATSDPYPDRSDRTAKFVSDIHRSTFPHLGITRKYMTDPVGAEAYKILEKEMLKEVTDMQKDGTITAAR